jgi:hypothetical protein
LNTRDAISPAAFVAQLPRRLLSHPRGGALAVVGHIERAWGYSFSLPSGGSAITDFQSTLKYLSDGHPIGSALEPFNEKFGEYATALNKLIEDIKFGLEVDDDVAAQLAMLWTGNNDARGYAIVGDPAVRLPVGEGTHATERPTIEVIHLTTAKPEAAAEPALGQTAAPGQLQAVHPLRDSPGAFATPPVAYDISDLKTQIVTSVKQFAAGLSEALKKVVDELTTLEVTSYTSDQLESVTYTQGKVTGAKLRAVTRIKIDGDTLICVPETGGKVDDAIWALHKETVKMAQEHRAEMINTAVSAASALLRLF